MVCTKNLWEIPSLTHSHDLFSGDDTSGLRRRGANESSENMESYYSNIQEKLADEMLNLTRSLKDQTLAANKIIKKDTEVNCNPSNLLP